MGLADNMARKAGEVISTKPTTPLLGTGVSIKPTSTQTGSPILGTGVKIGTGSTQSTQTKPSQVVQSPSPMDIGKVSQAASSSLPQRLNATGATPGEAQRFANIAQAASSSTPPPPPSFTPPKNNTSTTPAPTSGTTPTPTYDPAPMVYATPAAPPKPPPPPAPPPIKSAPIDTVLFNDELVSEEEMLDLLFQDIGGHEILFLSRHDTVNGQRVSYRPLKNLDLIQEDYSPDKILRLEGTSESIFNDFIIDLSDKIPNVGNGPDGLNYYIDETDGSLVIEFINLESDEEIEVQVTSSGTIEDIGV